MLELIQILNKRDKWGGKIGLYKCLEEDCGNIKEIHIQSVNSGNTKSCGCIKRKMIITRNTLHGKSTTKRVKSPEYECWQGMKRRCFNKNNGEYKRYGERGIRVCDNWKNNFKQFYTDMGSRPTKDHSIDRIDVNGDYCKENCRWATIEEQNRNKRDNHYLEYKGEKRIVNDWAKIYNIRQQTILKRLNRGWTVEETLTLPPKTQIRKVRNK